DLIARGAKDEQKPASQKRDTTGRREGTEPLKAGQREHVETAAEDDNSQQKAPPGPSWEWPDAGEHEHGERMDELIAHGNVEYFERAKRGECRAKPMRAECADCHREKSAERSDLKSESWRHPSKWAETAGGSRRK